MFFYKKLESIEKKAFKLHFIYSIIEGIVIGVTLLNEFVFLRSLKGSEFLTGILFFGSVIVYLSLIFFNELIRRSNDKKKLIRITALITRLPLLVFVFFPNQLNGQGNLIIHLGFILIFFFYFLGTTITLPTINLLLKDSYKKNNFGKLYGYSATANKLSVLIGTFVFGQMLYQNYFVFRFVYPSIGILSIVALFTLSTIPFKQTTIIIKNKFATSLKNSLKRMYSILVNDKAFFHFELAFFAYGIAFMITSPVITFFFESYMKLSYAGISTYKAAAGIITVIALPLLGILSDKIDPRRFGIINFSAMLVYVLFIMITEYIQQYTIVGNIEIYYTLVVAFFAFGIFNAAGALSWNIGSSFFSKNANDSADYQSVHISLTGIRALMAPMGVLIYTIIGYKYTFGISIFFLILAILILIISTRKKQ